MDSPEMATAATLCIVIDRVTCVKRYIYGDSPPLFAKGENL